MLGWSKRRMVAISRSTARACSASWSNTRFSAKSSPRASGISRARWTNEKPPSPS